MAAPSLAGAASPAAGLHHAATAMSTKQAFDSAHILLCSTRAPER